MPVRLYNLDLLFDLHQYSSYYGMCVCLCVFVRQAEDVRSQMAAMAVPRPLLKRLVRALDRTVSDAQERLAYCAGKEGDGDISSINNDDSFRLPCERMITFKQRGSLYMLLLTCI
jgi:hypothetical protein